jgi:hypothetical protein
MKTTMLLLILILWLAGQSCSHRTVQAPPPPPPPAGSSPAPAGPVPVPAVSATEPAPPAQGFEVKLDAPLLELVRDTTLASEKSLSQWSAKHRLTTTKGQVAIDITCRTEQEASVVAKAVKKAGGKVTAQFQKMVFASVPASAVKPVATLDEVWTMAVSRALMRPK